MTDRQAAEARERAASPRFRLPPPVETIAPEQAVEYAREWGQCPLCGSQCGQEPAERAAAKLDALSVRLAQAEQERDENEIKVLARIAERGDLKVLGLPVDDLHSIYQLVSDWNRMGGRPSLIEDLREREQLKVRLREYEEALRLMYDHGGGPGSKDYNAVKWFKGRDLARAALAASGASAGGREAPKEETPDE